MRVYPHTHPQLQQVITHLAHVWHECGILFERSYSLHHSIVASFALIHHLTISANYPKSGATFVVVKLWGCIHMTIHNCRRCKLTLYMYAMNVRCSLKLKWFTASTLVWWHHFQLVVYHLYFQPTLQNWDNICGGNMVWGCIHLPILNWSRWSYTLHMYYMNVGYSLKGLTVSTTA